MQVHSTVLKMVTFWGLTALAQTARASDLLGFYAGGNGGIAQIDAGEGRFDSQLESQVSSFGALDFTSTSLRRRDAAWWANAGYLIGANVGIEADYLHFGKLYSRLAGTYVPTAAGVQTATAWRRLRSEGPALGLLFRLPLTDRISLNLRIADYYSRTTLAESNSLGSGSYTASSQTVNYSSLLLGLGAAYRLGEQWSARADYQRVQAAGSSANVGRYDVDMLSIGLGYSF